jgi:hypothetical protein
MEKKDFYLRVALTGALAGVGSVVAYEQIHGASGSKINVSDQEQVKSAEIGNFEMDGNKIAITHFDEITDKDPDKKTVLIYGKASADPTDATRSGKWAFDLGTKGGHFSALMVAVPGSGPTEAKSNLDSAYPYGVVIVAVIPSGITAYSLNITNDIGTTESDSGGTSASSSFSLPIRQEDFSPNRT